jgi:hypothetical protein
MQYKNATKIIIDKRKLDILIRLGCPDNQILQILKTGKFTPTGDSLIDETLECLVDFKEFKNWGGNHNPKGINGCNKKKKRGQVDQQVDSQDDCQVVDKDKDKDKRFKKPLLDEIREYCKERNNTVDCERFFDFYESKGWKVGNQPMKDWKAAVRNWEKSSKPKQKTLYEKCVENGLKFLEDTND